MQETAELLPLAGRQDLVAKVIDRLVRPDDVRETYGPQAKQFIVPGFFGLAGVGKTRLLQAIEAEAQQVTPYVVWVSFDGSRGAPPGTPRALVLQVIENLAALDAATQPGWRRMLGRGPGPLDGCRALLTASGGAVEQRIEIRDSELEHVTLGQHAGDATLPAGLDAAMSKGLAGLHVKGAVQRRSGGMGKPAPRPLVVVLLDTVEAAPAPVRAWLPTGLAGLWGANGLHYHVLVVAAGRERVPGLLETELPALTEQEAVLFVRSYVAARQRADERYATPRDLAAVREATPVQARLLELGAGIPLLLGLLADVAVRTPERLTAGDAPFPASHAERFRYVLEAYLGPVEARADATEDGALSGHLRVIKYGALPRRLPRGSGLLRALLLDLPGSGFTAATDYDALRRRLAREAFVMRGEEDSLIYHELMREGLLAAVAGEDRGLWQDVQRRAAAWFAAQGDEAARLYHALQGDYAGTIGDLRGRIEAVLAGAQWAAAQGLIDLTGDVALTREDEAWLTLYKAQLAQGEGNVALRTQRLERLMAEPDLPAALRTRLAERMAAWYEVKPADAKDEGTNTDEAPKGIPLDQLLWWARQNGIRRWEAQALRGLGDAARMQDRYGEAAGHYQAALALYRAIEDRLGEANALLGLGDAARMQARYGEAAGHYQAALALYRAIEYRLGEANALLGLGDAARMQARYGEAAGHYQAALALYRAIEYRLGEANALRGLGEAALMQARYGEAAGHYQAALALYRAIEYRLGEANALLGLGDAARMQARYGEAAGHYQAALALYRAIEYRLGEANALRGLGEAALMQARYGEAAGHYQAALALSRAIEDRLGEANALRGLGEAALMQARYGEAAGHYQAALALSRAIEDRLGEANALRGLGDAARMQDRYGEAAGHYQAALALYRAIEYRLGEANALLGLGEAARMQARYGEAAGHYQAALALYRAIEDRLGEANALRGLGDAARMQDRYGEAAGHYQAALALYRAIEDRLGEANALLGLGDAARMQARYGEAAGHYQAALALYRAIEYRLGEANALLGLGDAARMQARYGEAAGHYQAALALYRAIEYRLGEANALNGLGDAARMQARYGEAAGHYQATLAFYRAIGLAAVGVNNLLVAANQALGQAGDAAAVELARTLYRACRNALPQTDADAVAAYNLEQRMLVLGQRLGE